MVEFPLRLLITEPGIISVCRFKLLNFGVICDTGWTPNTLVYPPIVSFYMTSK